MFEFLKEVIASLNNNFIESPGQSEGVCEISLYGEYIVEPENDETVVLIVSLLLDKTTVEVLPNLSDKTTPAW